MRNRNILLLLISFLFLIGNAWSVKATAATPSKPDDLTETDSNSGIIFSPRSGYFEGTIGFDKININTDQDPTHVIFFWDDTLYPSVRIYGESHNYLNEFELGDIDTITLSGKGEFTLEIYARNGYGNWSCDAMDEFDYQLVYGDCLQDIIAAPLSGYLENSSEVDKIKVDSIVDTVHAVFEWDSGMELWVEILSENDESLGEFNLDDGNVIDLTGTGIFILQLTARSGYGNWNCEVLNDEDYNSLYGNVSFNAIEINNSVYETDEKSFISNFLKDMVAYDTEKLKSYISPDYLSLNNLNINEYSINTYSPANFAIDGFNDYTSIIDCRIWGENQDWMHALEFKIVEENGKYYIYPSETSGEYIHPWHSVTNGIK